MPFNRQLPGPQVVASKFLAHDVLVQNAYSDIFSVHQPAGSVLEKVFVRVIKAPTLGASGSIALEVGTETADPNNVIDDTTALNNVLSGSTTIALNTVVDLTSDLESGVPTTFRADETELNFRFKLTNVSVTTNASFEVSFIFRVFE